MDDSDHMWLFYITRQDYIELYKLGGKHRGDFEFRIHDDQYFHAELKNMVMVGYMNRINNHQT